MGPKQRRSELLTKETPYKPYAGKPHVRICAGGARQLASLPLKRRDFIVGLGGAVAWPVVARAEQSRTTPRIGVLWSAANEQEEAPLLGPLQKSISANGVKMGGSGSGGHNSKGRMVAEGAMRLNIRELRRNRCLAPGQHGSICWSQRDGSQSSIAFETELHAINLAYTWTDHRSGQVHCISERVDLEHSRCRFGGRRPYFLCPGCPNNVEVLFLRGGRFRCRACAHVVYASQNERPVDRARRRARKIRHRLGAGTVLANPLPEKPKGMWLRTYYRLTDRLMAAESTATVQLLAIARRLAAGSR